MKKIHPTQGFRRRASALLAVALLIASGQASHALAQTGMTVSTAYTFADNSYPTALAYGPEAALWLALGRANAVGSLALPSTWQPAALPSAGSRPFDLTIGPDGALWFTEQSAGKIGRLGLDGALSEFPLDESGRDGGSYPAQIVLGQDGRLWFTEYLGNRIGWLAPDGTLGEYPLPNPDSRPLGIVSALDGSLWFTEWNGRRIGKITGSGEISEYPVPLAAGRPTEITLGPDGALWFVYEIGQNLVRVDPETAAMVTYSLASGSTSFLDLAVGPDGWLWLLGTETVGRLSIPVSDPPVVETARLRWPVYNSEGRSQIIAGPGAEMYFITGNRQELQRASLPAALGRDVQVFVHSFPPVMLLGGPFEMDVEIVNWSSSPATGLSIVMPLPENAHFLYAGVPGLNCVETDGRVSCQIAQLVGGASLTIPFFFQFDKISEDQVSRRFEVTVSAGESDYLPANNRAYRALTFQRSIDYFNDFSGGSDAYWSDDPVGGPGDLHYLGGFDNQTVTLSFRGLPHHDRANLCFDLYVLGAWDGDHLTDPSDPGENPRVIGPDLWSYYIDNAQLSVTTFSNQSWLTQSYPSEYNEGTFPARSASAASGEYDGDPATSDSRYHFCAYRLHAQSELQYTFYGANLDNLSGEQWALDNVSVRLFYYNAYDWQFLPVLRR